MQAVIDIGSNTIRLLIGRVESGKIFDRQHFSTMPRLVAGAVDGLLTPDAIDAALVALHKLAAYVEAAGLEKPSRVTATSAVREAANKDVFCRRVADELGWHVQVLTGEEEAAISFAAASAFWPDPLWVLDIGGGSTEMIWRAEGKVVARSVPVGAVRLFDAPMDFFDLRAALLPLFEDRPPLEALLVGVGGTVTKAAAIAAGCIEYDRDAVQGRILTKEWLYYWRKEIENMSLEERLAKWPLLKKRVDIIEFGLDILLAVLTILDRKEIMASDAGLLDGLLLLSAKE